MSSTIRQKTKILFSLLLALMTLVFSFLAISPTFAQTGDATQTVTVTATQTPAPILTPTPSDQGNTLSMSLADFGYEDETLSHPFGQAEYTINTPGYWQMLPGSSLLLQYSTNSALRDPTDSAQLQVTLNDTLIYDTILSNFNQQPLNIPLPDVWPERTNEGYRLEISVYERGSCDTTQSRSITILAKSLLSLMYQPVPPQFDLALYPYPIYEPTFFPNSSYLALPDQPTKPEMEAGLSLVAGLGQLSNNNLLITTTTGLNWNQANALDEHLIVVGTPDSNPLIQQLNTNTDLPVSLRPRKLQLTTLGPNVIVPGSDLTYVIHLTNTEATPVTDLSLTGQLPPLSKDVTCQSACQTDNHQVGWTIGELLPGMTSTYTVTFKLPVTSALEAIDLTSELKQDQEIVNVTTLHSPINPNATPVLIHTKQASDNFYLYQGQAVPETDGIIQFVPSPWQPNKALLLVTGLTDKSVFKAGRALGSTAHFPGMAGSVALIQKISSPQFAPTTPNTYMSLKELGYSDRTVNNTGQQDVSYRFYLPMDWTLTSSASVRMLFSHSPLVDPVRSSLTLFFNGTPIASAALDESNAVAGELIGPLPPGKTRQGQDNTLMARVEMQLPDPCADVNSSRAWLNLDAASSVYLPHTQTDINANLDLDFLPLPYIANPTLTDILLALPEQPSNTEYDAAMKIMAQLGATSNGDNFQPSVLMGQPTDTDLSASHLVVIGRPSRSPLLQTANEMLPQPFLPQTDVIRQQIDDIIFRLPKDINLGYVQLIPSPWNANRALLAVTGTSDLGVNWSTQTLADSRRLRQLNGNLAILRNQEISTTDTREQTNEDNEANGNTIETIATTLPEATIIGTATPVLPTPTPTSPPNTPSPTIAPTANNAASVDNVDLTNKQSLPKWFPFMIVGGVILIVAILAIAYWQSRRRSRTGL